MLPVARTSLEHFLDAQREYQSPAVVRVFRSSPLPALLPSIFSKPSAPFRRGRVVADRSWIARMYIRISLHTVVARSRCTSSTSTLVFAALDVCFLFIIEVRVQH